MQFHTPSHSIPPLDSLLIMLYGPPLHRIFWGHIFCKYGGWGRSELLSSMGPCAQGRALSCPDRLSKNMCLWSCHGPSEVHRQWTTDSPWQYRHNVGLRKLHWANPHFRLNPPSPPSMHSAYHVAMVVHCSFVALSGKSNDVRNAMSRKGTGAILGWVGQLQVPRITVRIARVAGEDLRIPRARLWERPLHSESRSLEARVVPGLLRMIILV